MAVTDGSRHCYTGSGGPVELFELTDYNGFYKADDINRVQ